PAGGFGAGLSFVEGGVRELGARSAFERRERDLVEPDSSLAQENGEDDDPLGVRGDLPFEVHGAPVGGADDRPVGHVVEETALTVRPIDAQPELEPPVASNLGAYPGAQADAPALEIAGRDRLQQRAEPGGLAVDPLAAERL